MINLLSNIVTLGMVVKLEELFPVLLTTLVFVILGLVFFGVGFLLLSLLTPFSIRKEIEEDQNVALGVVIGAMLIGIAIIIAAAING
jgi:putative membrane protein